MFSFFIENNLISQNQSIFNPEDSSGFRGGSRAAATSKMERFVIIVNGWKPLTVITKRSILDVAAALDPPLGLKLNTIIHYQSFDDG